MSKSIKVQTAAHKPPAETRTLRRAKTKAVLPKQLTQSQAHEALQSAFELVGGVTRLVLWADDPENYEAFLKMWLQTMPKNQHQTLAQQAGPGAGVHIEINMGSQKEAEYLEAQRVDTSEIVYTGSSDED